VRLCGRSVIEHKGGTMERTPRLRVKRVVALAIVVFAAVSSMGVGSAAAAALATGTCSFPAVSQPLAQFGDANSYFLVPDGDVEGAMSGWTFAGGAGVVAGNESFFVGGTQDSHSLGLPTTSAVVTTPTMCVTADSPAFRMFIKNNGNLGHIDGQLAVYLNFTGADGKQQQVKIAALKVNSTAWTVSPKISFVQYISTPLKSGYANVSFTIKPNDNHGNWQLDDIYIDPYFCR
jgi:hypothetical protein